MISLWLWPLLALGADIESPEKPRMPDPRAPTLFEIEGEYRKIAQIYGRNYCISRIFVLASKLKKHIETTIEDPVQQNLRWRYITFLAATSNSISDKPCIELFVIPCIQILAGENRSFVVEEP
jgi:hypothetical protein